MRNEVERDPRGDPARPARDPVGHELRVRDARGRRSPAWFDDVRARRRRAPAAARAHRPRRRRARLPPLLRRRRARPLRRAAPTPASSSSVANALAASARTARSTGSTCRCRADATTTPTSRRWASCGCRPETELYLGLIHAGDDGARGAGSPPPAGASTRFGVATECGWGRGGAAAVAGLLRAAPRAQRAAPTAPGRRRARRSQWPAGFVRGPRRGLDEQPSRRPSALAYDHVDEHGWYRNLDPTVEELAATCATATSSRLLRRHRHPARPPAPAHLRPPRRRGDRRRSPSSCASRSRSTGDDPRVGVAAAALPQGRAAAAALDEVLDLELSTRSPSTTRSISTPTSTRRSARGCARCGPAGTCSSTPATSATRGRSRPSGSSTRRCG